MSTEDEQIMAKIKAAEDAKKKVVNTDREPPLNFDHNILEIKKELGIFIRRPGEESESDADRVYQYMLNKDVKKLKERTKTNYASRSKVYIDTRMKDPVYVDMNKVPMVGLLGNVEEVAEMTHDTSWRATTKPQGILYNKRFVRWRDGLPEGPTAETIMKHRRVRESKLLWKQVQADTLVDVGAEEAEKEAEERRLKAEEAAHAASNEMRLENLKWGRYELTRTKPTRAEFASSMKNWSKSIYRMGRWKTTQGFPSKTGLDKNKRPSEMTIREEDEYNRYFGPKEDNQYIDKMGDIHLGFAEHMVQTRCIRARKFLVDDANKKAKILRDKELKVKMEARKKRREEAEAREVARIKALEEEKLARHALDKERRTELMIIASAKIAQDAVDAVDAIARKTAGRKLAWVTPKDAPQTVEELVDELLAAEKAAAALAEEEAHRVEQEVELAFRKTFSGRIQTGLDLVNGITSKVRRPTKEELEELEMDRLEKEQAEEEAALAERKTLKYRPKSHEGISDKKVDRSKAFQSKKGAKKKPKGIWGHIKRVVFLPYTFMTGNKVPAKSKIDQRRDRKNRSAKIDKFKKDMDKKIIEAIFTARKKQKEAQGAFSQMMEGVNGSAYENEEFYLPDLLNAARAGDYNKCIDIMEHPTTPIGPNEYDESAEGMSATYVACMKMILGQTSENKSDMKSAALIDGDLTMYQRFKRSLRKKEADIKLEWVVKVLMHKGGDIDFVKACRDEDGLALLHVACERGLDKIVTWLLDKGANPNVLTSKSKRTPLSYACEHDMIECILILMARGGMKLINYQDNLGRSALHWMAIEGSPQNAQALMICGAKALRCKKGRTPSEEAQSRGKMEMYEKLLYFTENDDEHVQRLTWLEDQQADGSEVHSEPG
jgi:hypothetical protein